MTKPTKPYYFTNKAARVIPFFFTAATCLDFMLTPTSLEFFEWIKFESIYNTLFEDIYKMNARDARIPGLKINKGTKMMYGIGGTVIQIIVILLPLYSFKNWTSTANDISNAAINVDLVADKTRLTLYTNKYSKSVSALDNRQYSTIFKEKAGGDATEFELNTLQSDKIKMVSFFERSDAKFSPSLKHLEEMTEKLVSQ